MKVLIVNDGFPPHSWGGANTIAYLHAEGLRERGHEVKVFTTTQAKEREVEGEYEGIPVRTFYTAYHYRWWAYKSINNAQVTSAFEKELKAFRPDVVHAHNIHHYFSYRTISIAKKSGAKVFLTAHDVMSFAYQKLHNFIAYSSIEIPTSFNYHVPWWVNLKDARLRFNLFRNFFIRRYLKKVDQIFAVSSALKQALSDNGIAGNVSVVHNGIDATSFEPSFDQDTLRKELVLVGVKIILFVGRFTPDKGRDVLLKAFAQVLFTTPAARLLVVGMNYEETEPGLSRLLSSLHLRDKVIFLPPVSHTEIFKYYRIADCVAVPSVIFDSFPTVNLEAMAAGKPVVASCFGGSREAVEDNVTGYIVNPLDIENLTQKMLFLLQHPQEAKTMGEMGCKRVEEHFTTRHMLDTYCSYYKL